MNGCVVYEEKSLRSGTDFGKKWRFSKTSNQETQGADTKKFHGNFLLRR
jgi:hypothetical protein